MIAMFLNWLDFIVVNKKGIIRENDKTAIYIENNIPRVPTNVAIEQLTEFIPKASNKFQSNITNVDGGWLVFRWDWGLLRIICNCLPFSLVFKLSIGIIASLNLRLHKSLAKRSTH